MKEGAKLNLPVKSCIYFSYDFNNEETSWKVLQVKKLLKKLGIDICVYEDLVDNGEELLAASPVRFSQSLRENTLQKQQQQHYHHSSDVENSFMSHNNSQEMQSLSLDDGLEEIINQRISNSSCVLLFLSKEYESRVNSTDVFDICRYEFIQTFKLNKVVIPILLDSSIKEKKNWSNRFGVYLDDLPYLDLSFTDTAFPVPINHANNDSLEETAVLKEQKERKENHFQFSLSIHQKKGKFLCDMITAVLLQQENTSNTAEKAVVPPLKELITTILPSKVVCPLHDNQPCKYYDLNTVEYLCEICWAENNEKLQEHVIIPEVTADQNNRDEIDANLQSLQSHIEKIYILENSSDTFLQELNGNSSKLKTEIHEHFQEVRFLLCNSTFLFKHFLLVLLRIIVD
jgi:hypothetical protein